jgi:N-terminal acetyltransferase B complex non-catalytic subunit
MGGFASKVAAIIEYLQGYGKASTAYNDLRPFVERLSPAERKQLLDNLKSIIVFSDAHKTRDVQYPTKEDVSPRLMFDFWLH